MGKARARTANNGGRSFFHHQAAAASQQQRFARVPLQYQARDWSHLGVIHKIPPRTWPQRSGGRRWTGGGGNGGGRGFHPLHSTLIGPSRRQQLFDTRVGLVQHLGERPHHFPSDRLQRMHSAAAAANGLSCAAATATVNCGSSIQAVANESAPFLSRIQPRITADARILILLPLFLRRLLPSLAGRFSYLRV